MFLQLLEETGARSGEAHALKWADIAFEAGVMCITPEKGSDPRVIKFSNELVAMLHYLKRKDRINYVFCKHLRTHRRLF